MDPVLVRNLIWLRGSAQIEREMQSDELRARFAEGIEDAGTHDRTMSSLLRTVSYRLRMPYPDAVELFKYLVWHKALLVDLKTPMLLTSQAPKIQVAAGGSAPVMRAA